MNHAIVPFLIGYPMGQQFTVAALNFRRGKTLDAGVAIFNVLLLLAACVLLFFWPTP